ncbi:MAG: hypothetical protein RIF33_26065 [Cyclobacteriaceae bacterium]
MQVTTLFYHHMVYGYLQKVDIGRNGVKSTFGKAGSVIYEVVMARHIIKIRRFLSRASIEMTKRFWKTNAQPVTSTQERSSYDETQMIKLAAQLQTTSSYHSTEVQALKTYCPKNQIFNLYISGQEIVRIRTTLDPALPSALAIGIF